MTISKLLIVIPCLNEERHLPALLNTALRENPDAIIVVADGGSTDGSRTVTREIARNHPNLKLLDNPQRIQSVGINRAVEFFGEGCDWLLRLDAHCEYPARYAPGLLETARLRDATSVVVPMVSRGRRCFQRAAAAAQNSIIGTGGSPHRHLGTGKFVDHGHHALMRLDLFRQVGGYREDMSHNEDAELDLRLAAAGGRIWLEPAQAIVYYPRSSPAALWRQYAGYGRGRAITLRLHRHRPKLRQCVPLVVLPAIALVLLSTISPWPALKPWLALPMAGWLVASLGGGLLVGLRARQGCAMASGIAAMIMHLSWATGFVRGLLGRLP